MALINSRSGNGTVRDFSRAMNLFNQACAVSYYTTDCIRQKFAV